MTAQPGVRYDALFISPHYDDAVFSCGALIRDLVLRQQSVHVLNVFTECRADSPETVHATVQVRRTEEARAAAVLGFETSTLGLQDAFHRAGENRPGATLFAPPGPDAAQVVESLTARLRVFLTAHPVGAIYAPLGVGWHIDHVLCQAALSTLETPGELFWYEDAPYCFVPAYTAARLAQLGLTDTDTSAAGTVPRFGEIWRRVRRTSLAQAAPPLFRAPATLVIAAFLCRLPSRHARSSGARPVSCLTPDLREHLAHKLAACASYTSQISEFYRSEADMQALYLEHSSAVDTARGYCERYWHVARRKDSALGPPGETAITPVPLTANQTILS